MPPISESEFRIEALTEASDAASIEAARVLLMEYGRFVLAAEGPARFCFGRLEDEAKNLPRSYAAQRGELLLGWVGDAPAGCVTYRALSTVTGACEMKRLWVRPEFRGMSLGERLIQDLITRARGAGFHSIYLDTMPASMNAAYGIYLRLGFAECAPFHESTAEGLVFMCRRLDGESR
jgi:putative acetyltransferase